MAYTAINKSTDNFECKLWTGNETDNRDITGFSFQPDFAWIKARNNAYGHALFDAVRGVNKYLTTVNDSAEADQPSSGYISQFNSDGYRLKHGSSTFRNVNDSDASTTYVSWNWKANGQGSANNDGSINTTYTSANTTAGFSIVKWTGTGSAGTLGHGLGVAPKVVLVKNTINAYNWCMYHESYGNTKALYPNLSSTGATSTTFWNDTSPTNSVFSIGSDLAVNKSGSAIIAYCFAEKKGFSKFGSYTGNGNVDGPFVYTGFKPAFLLIKSSTYAGNWLMYDNKREIQNIASGTPINANEANAESTATNYAIDFLSNGFKLRNNNGNIQNNTETMFYLAFAAEPLVANVGSGIPATAV